MSGLVLDLFKQVLTSSFDLILVCIHEYTGLSDAMTDQQFEFLQRNEHSSGTPNLLIILSPTI